jgi:hypothetical protein
MDISNGEDEQQQLDANNNASTSSLQGLATSGSSSPRRAAGTRTPRFDMSSLTMHHISRESDDDDEPNRYDGDDSAQLSDDERSPPASTTPTWEQSYSSLKKNLSYKSLRELELKHVQKQLWRRQGEPRKRPRDLEQLAIYAFTGAARKGGYALAYI